MFKASLVLGLAWSASCWSQSSWQDRVVFRSPIRHGVISPVAVKPLKLHKLYQTKHHYHNDHQTPRYYETEKLVEQMEELVMSYTSFHGKPPLKDPRRHYLTLLGVVYHIIDVISDTCHPDAEKYEEDYMTLIEEYLSTALNDPNIAAAKINALISDAKGKTAGVRDVIFDLCGNDYDDPAKCDAIVNDVLSWGSIDHQKQAKLLLKLGDLAKLFEEVSTEFEDVAANQQEMSYLLDLSTKKRLKPLALTAVEVILALNGDKTCHGLPKLVPSLPYSYKPVKYSKQHKYMSPLDKLGIMKVMSGVWGGLVK